MTSLTDLLVRLEAAEGADRELDAALGFALAGWERLTWQGEEWFSAEGAQYPWPPRPGQDYPALTDSLDASLGLVERVLPEADFDICYRRGKLNRVSWYDRERRVWVWSENPLALLCAMVKALIARDFAGSDTSEPLLSPRETK